MAQPIAEVDDRGNNGGEQEVLPWDAAGAAGTEAAVLMVATPPYLFLDPTSPVPITSAPQQLLQPKSGAATRGGCRPRLRCMGGGAPVGRRSTGGAREDKEHG